MDLRKIIIDEPKGNYGSQEQRKYALKILENLSNDTDIKEEHWPNIIKSAEGAYWTTFTDDSDYIPGKMNLKHLNNLPYDIREKVLEHINKSGNWIVRRHIKDYRKHLDYLITNNYNQAMQV
jgi:hypothetical protein